MHTGQADRVPAGLGQARRDDGGDRRVAAQRARPRSRACARRRCVRTGLVRSSGQPLQIVLGGPDYAGDRAAGATGCSRAWRRTRACSTRTPTTRRRGRSCASRSTSSARPTSASRPRRSAATLETMMGSRRVTTFVEDGEEYDVVLQARADDRAAPANLENLYVRSGRSGELVPLSILVTLTEIARARHAQPLQPAARHHALREPGAGIHARRGDRVDARRPPPQELPDVRAARLQGPVARVPDRGRRGAVHVRDGAAHRLPRARGAVRELHPSVRDHADGAARGDSAR